MFTRLAIFPVIFLFSLSTCKRHAAVVSTAQAASSPTASATAAAVAAAKSPATSSSSTTTTSSPATAGVSAPKPGGKVVVDQTAQVIIFCYHRLVDKIRYPGTEIRPADFEAEMKALKDHGITVIGMQDFLAWRRGEKNIPARSAIVTFDDGWKSQYDIAWPIMKKYGYPFTLFIYI